MGNKLSVGKIIFLQQGTKYSYSHFISILNYDPLDNLKPGFCSSKDHVTITLLHMYIYSNIYIRVCVCMCVCVCVCVCVCISPPLLWLHSMQELSSLTNPCLLQWKFRVLTTDDYGNPCFIFLRDTLADFALSWVYNEHITKKKGHKTYYTLEMNGRIANYFPSCSIFCCCCIHLLKLCWKAMTFSFYFDYLLLLC